MGVAEIFFDWTRWVEFRARRLKASLCLPIRITKRPTAQFIIKVHPCRSFLHRGDEIVASLALT